MLVWGKKTLYSKLSERKKTMETTTLPSPVLLLQSILNMLRFSKY